MKYFVKKGYVLRVDYKHVVDLLESIKIDSFSVVCHFKCEETNRSIVSVVAFEPYDGKIELTLKDILLHPFKTYNRYYHTPIVIYGEDAQKSIVVKAFEKVSNSFRWNPQKQKYTCMHTLR